MKISLGADHAGYLLKEDIKKHLISEGYEVIDNGTDNQEESVDYPKFAIKASELVSKKKANLGILVCGTGIGMSIAANKVKGIRCALIYDSNTAMLAKKHNNANVIALGGRVLSKEEALHCVDVFLNEEFEKRHQNRLDLIEKYEG